MKNDKITDRDIVYDGKTFTSPDGYPKFAFKNDEVTGKIAIANVDETSNSITEATEPFVDEVKYSELPLETWTADYVVVRIGELWYLADSFGNCYFESHKPYIICRNVFVAPDKSFVVNKELKKVEFEDMKIDTIQSGGYLFAYIYYSYVEDSEDDSSECKNEERNGYLINCEGEKVVQMRSITTYAYEEYNKYLYKWIVRAYGPYNSYLILNKEFKDVASSYYSPKIIGVKSKTYELPDGPNKMNVSGPIRYSTYFDSLVKFQQFRELEVIEYKGKTYFFRDDGKIDVYDCCNLFFQDVGDFITYRIGTTIYARAYTGEEIESVQINLEQVYQYALMESIIKK